MKTHFLKTESKFFQQVKKREKRFELRKDDRGFAVGDLLMLQEVGEDGNYTGDSVLVFVSNKLEDVEKFGLKKGHAILGISFYEECDRELQEVMENVCKSPIER